MPVEPMATQRGHPELGVQQFSVFAPNQVGKFRELMNLFIEHETHVVALDVINSLDWAVVRVITSDSFRARDLLREAKCAFTECSMLAIELDTADSLADMAGALLAAEVNLLFAYPLLVRTHGRSVVAVHVDNRTMAYDVLKSHGFTLLDESELWESEDR